MREGEYRGRPVDLLFPEDPDTSSQYREDDEAGGILEGALAYWVEHVGEESLRRVVGRAASRIAYEARPDGSSGACGWLLSFTAAYRMNAVYALQEPLKYALADRTITALHALRTEIELKP